jgi:hypothetical protein
MKSTLRIESFFIALRCSAIAFQLLGSRLSASNGGYMKNKPFPVD